MGHAPDWLRGSMKKSAGTKIKPSHKNPGNPFHGPNAVRNESGSKPVQRFADGGEVFSGDKVGFWERLKAGNIDEPGSEAYNRWGAGKVDQSDAETNRLARHVKVDSDTPASHSGNAPEGDVEYTPPTRRAAMDEGTSDNERSNLSNARSKPVAETPRAKTRKEKGAELVATAKRLDRENSTGDTGMPTDRKSESTIDASVARASEHTMDRSKRSYAQKQSDSYIAKRKAAMKEAWWK